VTADTPGDEIVSLSEFTYRYVASRREGTLYYHNLWEGLLQATREGPTEREQVLEMLVGKAQGDPKSLKQAGERVLEDHPDGAGEHASRLLLEAARRAAGEA
jgi:hypothetical protein